MKNKHTGARDTIVIKHIYSYLPSWKSQKTAKWQQVKQKYIKSQREKKERRKIQMQKEGENNTTQSGSWVNHQRPKKKRMPVKATNILDLICFVRSFEQNLDVGWKGDTLLVRMLLHEWWKVIL